MLLSLHKNATTTPAIREAIRKSDEPIDVLAARHGQSRDTIIKWKHRESTEDRSHTPHQLRKTLNDGQEALVLYLRTTLLLPLDDLLAVVREFIAPEMSRSALDRMLRRHGVSKLPKEPEAEPAPSKPFKAYEPGFVHIDVKYLPQMQDEDKRRYAFVAIDRATRWVYVQLMPDKTSQSAERFLKALHAAAPFHIRTILTDNGKEFTDRFTANGARQPTGSHGFDQRCSELGIDHRLIPPGRPQTNGMVERFNGRIAEVLRTHHFRSRDDLASALKRYVWLYNQHLPQKAIHHRSPIETMKDWQQHKPELFKKAVRNHPGPDR